MASKDSDVTAKISLFKDEARVNHIKEKTIEKLLNDDYDSKEALACMETIDLAALNLSGGQRGLLKKWLSKIRKELEQQTPDPVPYVAEKADEILGVILPRNDPLVEDRTEQEAAHYDDESGAESNEDSEDEDDSETEAMHQRDQETRDQIERYLEGLNIRNVYEEEIRQHVQEHGVDGLDKLLSDMLLEFMKSKVNIAVVGRSGTGKSTLINSMRNLSATDPGAAGVGVIETTMLIHPYAFPKVPNVIIWDVPGHSTTNFPKDQYLDKIEFGTFDAFIIICTDRVYTEDIWLAQEISNPTTSGCTQRPYYFVRTKLDNAISDNANAGQNEQETISAIENYIFSELTKASLPTENVYLLSGSLKYQTHWGFPKLMDDLYQHTPPKNKAAMVLAMVSCTKDIIISKKMQLIERMKNVALRAAAADDEEFENIIGDEIKLYTERLGITDLDLKNYGVDMRKLSPRLREIKRQLKLFLKWFSIEQRMVKFIVVGANALLSAFNFRIVLDEWEKNRKKMKQEQEESAKDESFQLKRHGALNALDVALNKSVALALGVLQYRKLMAEPNP